jgi:acyl-CoA thioester hydrolase
METSRKLVQTSLIPIRWGDMDAYGHVNNTIYFRYMEQIRVEYLEQLGFKVRPEGTAPVIINASCTFLIPLNYPGVVDIRMYCARPGRSSIPTHYEIRLQGDDTLYATGDSKIVWMDVSTGKSVSIPDELRAQLPA